MLNTKMIPAGRTTESVCKEMIRLCFQHYNLDNTKHIDPDRDIKRENRKLKNPNRGARGIMPVLKAGERKAVPVMTVGETRALPVMTAGETREASSEVWQGPDEAK